MSHYSRRYHLHRFSRKDFHQCIENAHPTTDCFQYHLILGSARRSVVGKNGHSSFDLLFWHDHHGGYSRYYPRLNYSTWHTWRSSDFQTRFQSSRRSNNRYRSRLVQVNKDFNWSSLVTKVKLVGIFFLTISWKLPFDR